MSEQPSVVDQLSEIFGGAFTAGVTAVPRVLAGVAAIIVMVIVAKLIERGLRAVLTRLRFDALLQQAGIDRTLQRIGLRQSLNVVLPRLVYFLLLCLIARIGADLLGLTAVSQAFAAFFAYLPNIVAAVLLLAAGSAASQFAGNTVAAAAGESGIDIARPLGNLVSGLILFVVGIMALAQLKIDTDIIRIVTICSLSGLALAFGLSFGFGTQDITRNILAGFYARKIFKIGDTVELLGQRGTVRAITTTQTLLEVEEGGTVSVANRTLVDEIVRSR